MKEETNCTAYIQFTCNYHNRKNCKSFTKHQEKNGCVHEIAFTESECYSEQECQKAVNNLLLNLADEGYKVDEKSNKLENKLKFQEIKRKAQEQLLDDIRRVCQIPVGQSILEHLKPVEPKKENKVKFRKASNKEDRNKLKELLNLIDVYYDNRDSTRTLFKKLVKSRDKLTVGSDEREMADQLVDKIESNL